MFLNTVVLIQLCVGVLQTPHKCLQCFSFPHLLEIAPSADLHLQGSISECRVASALKEQKGSSTWETGGEGGEQQTPTEAIEKTSVLVVRSTRLLLHRLCVALHWR